MLQEKYDVCIIGGLGHAGLPLGISFANAGKKVILYDIDQKAISMVRNGQMPFLEKGADPLLKKVINKNLFVTDDKTSISQSYFIVIVIGTPVDRHLNPDFTGFLNLFEQIIDCFHDNQHIILRSTILPGTTEKVKQYLALKGRNVRLSFCPERISEGNAIEELQSLPQIISSYDERAFEEAKQLFLSLTREVISLGPKEAELGKLFTNVWRYIQFATANQFYQIAAQHRLDFYEIYKAITYNYPRASNFPGAGFTAGPCLFKDTMQLASFSNNSFFLGHAAMLINEGLPNFIVERVKVTYRLIDMTVGILGMAFKGNSDDKRESLAFKLKKLLEVEAKRVLCSDVYISDPRYVSSDKLIRESDLIILAAPHREYKELRIEKEKPIIDIWDFFGKGGVI